MATKKEERETLTATLQKQETDQAAKSKKLSESMVTRDDTADQLAADEKFSDTTKEGCQTKATQWSVRVRMRTEELNGMQLAIKILSGGAKTFESSTSTFVQLAAVTKHSERSSDRAKAYNQLKALATQFLSRNVAKIAVEVKSGGHFDKVITTRTRMSLPLGVEPVTSGSPGTLTRRPLPYSTLPVPWSGIDNHTMPGCPHISSRNFVKLDNVLTSRTVLPLTTRVLPP
jgi:hypothetical protein